MRNIGLGGGGEGGDGFSRAYVNVAPSSRRRQVCLHHTEKPSPLSPLAFNALQMMRKSVVMVAAQASPNPHQPHRGGGWRHWRRFGDTWKESVATVFALLCGDLARFGEGSDGSRAYGTSNHAAAESTDVVHRLVRETIASVAASLYLIGNASKNHGDNCDFACRQVSLVSPLEGSDVQPVRPQSLLTARWGREYPFNIKSLPTLSNLWPRVRARDREVPAFSSDKVAFEVGQVGQKRLLLIGRSGVVAVRCHAGQRAPILWLLRFNSVARAVLALRRRHGPWTGTAAALLSELTSMVEPAGRRPVRWPVNSSGLSHALSRSAGLLARHGAEIERRHSGLRTLTLRLVDAP